MVRFSHHRHSKNLLKYGLVELLKLRRRNNYDTRRLENQSVMADENECKKWTETESRNLKPCKSVLWEVPVMLKNLVEDSFEGLYSDMTLHVTNSMTKCR